MKHKLSKFAFHGYDYSYRGFNIKCIRDHWWHNMRTLSWEADGLRGEKIKGKTLKEVRDAIDTHFRTKGV